MWDGELIKLEIHMETLSDAICPLCSKVCLRERLYSHIDSEHQRVRERTIEVIQGYHEGWSADDGACEPCWKSFREAGRVLNLLKQVKPKRPGHEWQKTGASGQTEDAPSVQWSILS